MENHCHIKKVHFLWLVSTSKEILIRQQDTYALRSEVRCINNSNLCTYNKIIKYAAPQ